MIKNTDYIELGKTSRAFDMTIEFLSKDLEGISDEKTVYLLKMQRWILTQYSRLFNELDKSISENNIITYKDFFSHLDIIKEIMIKDEKRLQVRNLYFTERILPGTNLQLFTCKKCNKTVSLEVKNDFNCDLRKIKIFCKKCKKKND